MSDLACVDKVVFETRQLASAAALLAEMTHGTKLKVYKCRHCNLWHMASA